MKPNLRIVENDPPETEYKNGDGGGGFPSRQSNDSDYGWRVPVVLWVFRSCVVAGNRRALGFDMDNLLMGMSANFEAAIAEGATWMRIGFALFGPRPDAGALS